MRNFLNTKATNLLSGILRTPPYIILFVSDKCPNNCLHCWYTKDWKKKNITNKFLTFDEYEKLSKSISRINFLSVTGGEAFMRDDLEDIIRVFIKNSKIKRLDIPTSGFDSDLIRRKAVNILSEHRDTPFRIDVSLDGLEYTHNRIRRNSDAYLNAVKTIRILRELRKKHHQLDISLITTISRNNYLEIEDLSKLVEILLPDGEWMVNIVRGSGSEVIAGNNELESYKKANDVINLRIKNNRFVGDRGHSIGKWLTAKNSLRRDIITEISESKRKGGCCAAGSLAGVIFNDGEVRPCESLDVSFGNVRDFDYNLPELWNSHRAKQIREEIQYSNCLCTHECFLSVSILLQPSSIFRLIKKRIVLNSF